MNGPNGLPTIIVIGPGQIPCPPGGGLSVNRLTPAEMRKRREAPFKPLRRQPHRPFRPKPGDEPAAQA